jgi:CheY-like chemotaxis protein
MKKKLDCILLVDDDEPTNFLNYHILEETGCTEHIEVAQGVQEALDYLTCSGKFKQADSKYPAPDLIFLDINMPAMDGWEFLEKYKNLKDGQKGKVIVVMLTTSCNPDDEWRAKDSPYVSGFANKPLTQEMVDNILNRFFPECY